MPVYRGPDGKIIEERSGASSQAGGKAPIDEPTRKVSSRPAPPDQPVVERDSPQKSNADIEEATQMVARSGASSAVADQGTTSTASEDPVAGWLVVTDGPGRGQDFSIRYGRNSIGRAEGQSVRLDFGDSQISRDAHAILTYDPQGRAFYIQGGAGRSLTYMDGEVVLAPQPIKSGAELRLGETCLRFIAFCGPDFDWASDKAQEG